MRILFFGVLALLGPTWLYWASPLGFAGEPSNCDKLKRDLEISASSAIAFEAAAKGCLLKLKRIQACDPSGATPSHVTQKGCLRLNCPEQTPECVYKWNSDTKDCRLVTYDENSCPGNWWSFLPDDRDFNCTGHRKNAADYKFSSEQLRARMKAECPNTAIPFEEVAKALDSLERKPSGEPQVGDRPMKQEATTPWRAPAGPRPNLSPEAGSAH